MRNKFWGSLRIYDFGRVEIRFWEGDILMSANEIADTFAVFPQAVRANIRAILKTEGLHKCQVVKTIRLSETSSVDKYDFEMITALAFRINSYRARIFRRWLLRKVVTNSKQLQVAVSLNKDDKIN